MGGWPAPNADHKTYKGGQDLGAGKTKLESELKAFDHQLLDQSAEKSLNSRENRCECFCGLFNFRLTNHHDFRQFHKYKDSREQFEMRAHTNATIDILNPTPKTVDALMRLNLPAGVDIEIKL